MSYVSMMLFVIAIVAGVFGFAGLASGAAGIATLLFGIFLASSIASVLLNAVARDRSL